MGAGLAVLFGIYLRFRAGSALWLDEALTVHIAKLPLGGIVQSLKHDGSPPLFYVLLHFWMKVFMTSAFQPLNQSPWAE